MAARETILDAAAQVMREKGIARTTTKEIAREAGYSEALLYKHFTDKQDIYMAVLKERVGGLPDPLDLVGTGDVHDNLVEITRGLMGFFTQSFPMSASLFSDTALLELWRDTMMARGGGPRVPIRMVEGYLEGEVRLGRLDAAVDTRSIAALLCGAAFQHGVFAAFDGFGDVPEAEDLAERLVSALKI